MYNGIDYSRIFEQIEEGNFNLWDYLDSYAYYISGLQTLIAVLSILFLIFAVIGFIQCFFGYRLFRIFAAIQGFFVGAVLFTAIGAATDSGLVTFVLLLLGGVGGAVLAYRIYQIGVFLTTGTYIGLVLVIFVFFAAVVAADADFSILVVAFLIGFVVGGVLGVVFSRPLIIISTGLSGFGAVSNLFFTLHLNTGKISLLLGLLCTIAGICYQFKKNPKGTQPGPRSKQKKNAPTQQEGERGQNFASATDKLSKQEFPKETEEFCKYTLHYLEKNKLAGKILPYAHILLYVVTVILLITNSASFFVLPLMLCLLCFAKQRFEAIFVCLTLLLLRTLPYDFNMLRYGMGATSAWIYLCGIAVLVYLDVLSFSIFSKTERGKKLLKRAGNRSQASAPFQQQTESYSVQPDDMQRTDAVPTTVLENSSAEKPYDGEIYGTQPIYNRESENPTISVNNAQEDNDAELDATVRVSVDEIRSENTDADFGTVSQQVSADIKGMMDQPTQTEREYKYIFCAKCGNRMSSSDNFCIRCGSRLIK
jgi:hypothetical protein